MRRDCRFSWGSHAALPRCGARAPSMARRCKAGARLPHSIVQRLHEAKIRRRVPRVAWRRIYPPSPRPSVGAALRAAMLPLPMWPRRSPWMLPPRLVQPRSLITAAVSAFASDDRLVTRSQNEK
jgi:hypothetical protein